MNRSRATRFEGMLGDIDVAVPRDRFHHAGERLDRWDVAVDELKGLPVGATDADLEPDRAEVGVGDDSAHLEPPDLAGHDTVLDHGRRSRFDDQLVELEVVRVGRHRWRDRFGDRRAGASAPRRATP